MVIAIGVVLSGVVARRSNGSPNLPTRALAKAWGPHFSTEARLSGGFAYGSPVSTRAPALENLEFLAEAGRIQREAQETPDADTLHAWGIVQLLVGEIDEAIDTLQTAVALGDESSALFSDVAAAQIARATRNDRAIDWAQALEAAERAVEIDPDNLEAWFNRALCLQAMGLDEQADAAWTAFLARDRTSSWDDQARARLGVLRQRGESAVSDSCQGDWLDSAYATLQSTLVTWAQAQQSTVRTVPVPAEAVTLADCLVTRTGERYYEDVIAAARAEPARTAGLVLEVDKAEKARSKGDTVAAPTLAARLQPTLAARHPIRAYVDSVIGAQMYRDGRMSEAITLLGALVERCAAAGYGWIGAQASTTLAAVFYNHGDYDESLSRHRSTIEIYGRLRFRNGLVGAYGYAADAAQALADREAAWALEVLALRNADAVTSVIGRHSLIARPQEAAMQQGLYRVALLLGRAAMGQARASGNNTNLCASTIEMARIFARMQRAAEATPMLEEAAVVCPRIPDSGIRVRADAELQSSRAEALLSQDPQASEASALRALDQYAAAKWQKRLPTVYRTLGGALRRQRRHGDAVAALDRGISLLEAYEGDVANASQRVTYVDGLWDLYGDQVSLQADGGEIPAAFETADRGMAHSLRSSAGASVTELQRHLRADEMVLMPVVTRERTYVFSLTREAVRVTVAEVTRETVERAVRWLAISLPRAELSRHADEAAQLLSGWLIFPFAAQIASSKEVMIAADPVLQQVPFSFLPASPSDSSVKVIDRTAVTMCPSASSCLGASERHEPRELRVAILRQAAGGEPLPRLNWEVGQIARLYESASVEDASVTKLNEALRHADVVHYAGHAFVDPGPQGRSMLMLPDAPEGVARNRPIDEILSGPISARVVVLSACSTVRGRAFRGEGIVAMSSAFLRRGAANVVGTLWDVHDDAASELFVAFHKNLATGASPATALARAQRDQRARGKTAIDWAFPVVVARERPETVSPQQRSIHQEP